MTPARFRWGLILVQIGTLILLHNHGMLSDNIWSNLLLYFPLILIAIGIEKIFTRTRLQFIAYLSSVALFVGGLLIVLTGNIGALDDSFFSETTYRREHSDSVKRLHAVLNLKGTDIIIRDSGRDLIYGRFNRYTRKPKIEFSNESDLATISLSGRRHSYLGGIVRIDFGDAQDWYLKFSRSVPLELDCYGNGSDLHLNLSTTPLSKLYLEADDAKVYLKLGDMERHLRVSIVGEDLKLQLRVPIGIGLKVLGDEYANYLKKVGLVRADGAFVSDKFDQSTSTIEVDLDDHLRSFSLDFF